MYTTQTVHAQSSLNGSALSLDLMDTCLNSDNESTVVATGRVSLAAVVNQNASQCSYHFHSHDNRCVHAWHPVASLLHACTHARSTPSTHTPCGPCLLDDTLVLSQTLAILFVY